LTEKDKTKNPLESGSLLLLQANMASDIQKVKTRLREGGEGEILQAIPLKSF
jgi:hypothetical protein